MESEISRFSPEETKKRTHNEIKKCIFDSDASRDSVFRYWVNELMFELCNCNENDPHESNTLSFYD